MSRLDPEVELAGLPHRLVSYSQLRQIEWTPRKIRYHIAKGSLTPVIGGVYCLDSDFDPFLAKAIAVCLKYPRAFLSGAASAAYWGLRRGVPELHEFTVSNTCRPVGIDFAQFHYERCVDERDVFLAADGLRVSTPAKAVFEAAGRLDEFGLKSMIESGIQKKRLHRDSLEDVGSRLVSRGRRGTRLFRVVMSAALAVRPVHSEPELRLIEALREAGLEVVPQCPVRLASGYTVHLDAGIPIARVGLEVDGPDHDGRMASHRDKSRDLQVALQTWQVLRFPTEEIERRLRAIVPQVRTIVHQRAALFAARA